MTATGLIFGVSTSRQAMEQCRSAACMKIGLVDREVPSDGKWHATDIAGDPHGRGDGRIMQFPDGEGGIAMNWKTGEQELFFFGNGHRLTASDRQAHARRRAQAVREAEEQRLGRQAEAALEAQRLWDDAASAPDDHPYLRNKHIHSYDCRLYRGDMSIAGHRIDGALIVPLRDEFGDLSSLEFILPDGTKLFLPGGRKRGSSCTIGTIEGVACIAEGFATGASIHEAKGLPVVIAFDAGNLKPVAEAIRSKYPDLNILICGDHDEKEIGQTKAREAAEAIGGRWVVPSQAGMDWNDVHVREGLEAVRTAIQAHVEESQTMASAIIESAGVETLPPIIPLDEIALPAFPVEALPPTLQSMVNAVAQATETPVELAALMGLATVAAGVQRVFEVQMEPGYCEPLSIWAISALQSGNRKTSVHAQMTAPLRKKERELCEAIKLQRLTIESERANVEARIKGLRARLGNSEDFEDSGEVASEITKLETTKPTVPPVPSLWAQDVTPEKLGMLMADSGERLAILSDEGGIFDILAGRYSNGAPNLDLFLQGHSCSPVKVNRGSREELYLQRPALTLGLSPQPAVLRDLTAKPYLRDRGFLARVLFALPSSRLGFRTLVSAPVPPATETAYCRLIEALLSFEAPVNQDGKVMAYQLRPTAEASSEWKDFARSVEQHLRPGGRYEHITDWAGKLPGAAVRIAGLFHCVEHAQRQPHAVAISLETMNSALHVMAVLSEHALAAFDLLGADPALEGARKIWRWVEQGRRRSMGARECFQDLRGTFHRMANLEPCLEVLCERGHLLKEKDSKQGPGRKSVLYTVHPTLSKEWS